MDRNIPTLPRQVTRRAGRPQENGWCMQVASQLANADFWASQRRRIGMAWWCGDRENHRV